MCHQVNRTAAAVNAEGILGGYPDKHGMLYQHLHFSDSASGRALLCAPAPGIPPTSA